MDNQEHQEQPVSTKKSFTQIRKVNLFTSKAGKRKEEGYYEYEGGISGMASMAAKKGMGAPAAGGKAPEQIAFQIEVETEEQWRKLCRREGLIVVDVYAGWAGPCTSMISILKRVKVEVNDDRLWLAIANSDKISDLLMFKDQSEPTWLFIGGGKPVKVIRSANAPKLVSVIKSEFEHEVHCMQGKARRNLISIDDEVTRRKKAENEAIRLSKLVREEEEATDELNAIRKESSVRLMSNMEPYSILVIQNFLLETGVVTVIRDSLQGEFKIEQERLVSLDEAAVRNLFRIPYKIVDPNVQEDFGYNEPEPSDEETEREPGIGESDVAFAPPMMDGDDVPMPMPKEPKKKKVKMIDVKVPDGVIGDTLFMLLESLEMRKMLKGGGRPDRNSPLQTADDFLLLKVGPVVLKDAIEHAPYSMHALYGRAQYAPGVWCPRRYDDKRHVMIHFFPRFVTDLLMPSPAGSPKHMVAIFPASAAKNVSMELEPYKKDVYAEGKIKLPDGMADSMLKSWSKKADTDDYKQKKRALSGDVFAVSVNRKNSTLVLALQGQEPLHMSFDAGYGKVESGKLFSSLNIDVGKIPNSDEVVEKFLARSRPRVISLTELNEADLPPKRKSLNIPAASETMMDQEDEPAPPPPPPPAAKPKMSSDEGEKPKPSEPVPSDTPPETGGGEEEARRDSTGTAGTEPTEERRDSTDDAGED